MADFELKFIFPYNGQRLHILYRAFKRDGEYHGASFKPFGAKTLAFIDGLTEEANDKLWDEVELFVKKFNLPF